MNSQSALNKLKQGNDQYVAAINTQSALSIDVNLPDVSQTQRPFAIVLGCSDSRVPAEMVFNCSSGDLFVVRVAGNVAAPSQIGSIEFACQHFGSQLIVVMGHTHCGAVKATVSALTSPPEAISPNLASIVECISPAVAPLVNESQAEANGELINKAMQANINHAVDNLSAQSSILKQLIDDGQLTIVGADYDLETGKVTFYD